MAGTESRATVPTPAEVVWETLAGFSDLSHWATGIQHSSMLTGGPPGVGATRRVQVGRATLRETVEVWEPGRRLRYRIEGLPAVVTGASNTWVLVPRDGGGTEIVLTGEVTTKVGPAARVVARLLGRANEGLVTDLAARVTALDPGQGDGAEDSTGAAGAEDGTGPWRQS